MADATWAGQFKDWATGAGIIVGGIWAVWRFGHTDWLRRRAEMPSLEGNSSMPDMCLVSDDRVAVSLRFSWRNAGTRPVYIDDENASVEIYRVRGEIGSFVDPRQNPESLERLKIAEHNPLRDYGFYMLEPGTTSSLLTVPILPMGEVFIARNSICANSEWHPTGGDWQYSWERWQVFRTDLSRETVELPQQSKSTS